MVCDAEHWGWLLAYVFEYLGTGALILGVIGWFAYLFFARIKRYRATLPIAITKLLATIAIPPALALLYAALFVKSPEEFLKCIHDLPIYIIVGSLAVLWVSWKILSPNGSGDSTPK
jgi:hypothetical protein